VSRLIAAAWLALCLIVLTGAPALGQESSAEEQDERIPGVEIFEIESANHSVDPIDYEMSPPAGGEHHPIWQNCGFYEEPVIPEHAVHSQEHGAVWITYDPELDSDQIAALEQLATENQYLLVTPFLDLPAPVVASAWGAQLRLDRVDDPRLPAFIRQYAGNGPEPGAPCSGGTDETAPRTAGTPVGTPAATPATN
jgi:hypothetical protein